MRDFKKEYKWRREQYDVIKAEINKNLGTKFRQKLKKDKKTIAGWITENIEKYIFSENKK